MMGFLLEVPRGSLGHAHEDVSILGSKKGFSQKHVLIFSRVNFSLNFSKKEGALIFSINTQV